MTAFEGESFTLEHAGQTVTLEALSGWRCGECGEAAPPPAVTNLFRLLDKYPELLKDME